MALSQSSLTDHFSVAFYQSSPNYYTGLFYNLFLLGFISQAKNIEMSETVLFFITKNELKVPPAQSLQLVQFKNVRDKCF